MTYFTIREMRQKARFGLTESIVPKKYVANAEKVMAVAEAIREVYGSPIRVISGFRTEEYNKRCGGSPKSQHLTASAMDLQPMCKREDLLREVARLHSIAEFMADDLQIGGLGYYPRRWIHVDIRQRKDGHMARWQG